MYNPNYEFHQTGWTCPKCGRVYAPHVQECLYCNDARVVWAETTSDMNNWLEKCLKENPAISDHTPQETYLHNENISWRDWLDLNTSVWEE